MASRFSDTQTRYLPTKKSQQASRARIAKINELYESTKREHRNSVVSNNSTSVASEDQEADDCVRINELDYKLPDVIHHHVESAGKVKQENLINPFRVHRPLRPATPTTDPAEYSRAKTFETRETNEPYVKVSEANHYHLDDGEDDDYEAELRFTPKLKSRRSLITMRHSSGPQTGLFHADSNDKLAGSIGKPQRLRKANRTLSLRKTLGDPLPLPYIKKDSLPDTFSPITGYSEGTLSGVSIDKKRQSMEKKWRNLISQDKQLLEKRFTEMRRNSFSSSQAASVDHSIPPISVSTPSHEAKDSLSDLSREIKANRAKLDHIITLLTEQPKNLSSEGSGVCSREFRFWTGCIIVLVICNIYVYYYI